MVNRQGPLAPKLYSELRGEAYTAATAANIGKAGLAGADGITKLLEAIKGALQRVGPTCIGEIFDKYYDGGRRKNGMGIDAWLTARSEVRQQLFGAGTTTKIIDNVEAYFEVASLGELRQHLQPGEVGKGDASAVCRSAKSEGGYKEVQKRRPEHWCAYLAE